MKGSLVAILFFLFRLHGLSQVIPDSLRPGWSDAGAGTFFIDTANSADIMAFGAVGDGIANDLPALTAAIASLNGKNGMVYFPAGTYRLAGSVYMLDSVLFRGESAATTTLKLDLGGVTGNCINFQKNQTAPFHPVAGGYQDKSAKIFLDSAAAYQSGDYYEIRQLNGPWDTNPVFWAEYSVGQMGRIDSVSGDTLYLQKPLRIGYDSALQVEIRKINPRTNSGLECLRITRADSTAASVNYGLYFLYAANCRIRGVESGKHIGAHVWSEVSTGIEITGCYFHDAYSYDGSSTHGYGVALATHTGECKIENNIFRHLRHAMMVKQGANGNVFAYNYSIDPYRSEFPNDFGADVSLHGHYPFANLFEGNIHQNLFIDQAYGPAGPHNTFFRNRVELYGIILTGGTVDSDQQNFVGNDITGTGPFQGQYVLAGTGHFEHGNRDNGVITPPGTSTLSDTSYYLDTVPVFWNIPQAYPNIGTPHPLSGQTIPARERYLAGGMLTVCDDGVTGFIETGALEKCAVRAWYDAGSGFLWVDAGTCQRHFSRLTLSDSQGRIVFSGSFPDKHSGSPPFIPAGQLAGGMYLAKLTGGAGQATARVIVVGK